MRFLPLVLVLLVSACASESEPVGFLAGFGRADITPSIQEPWTDVNGDGVFSAADGDTFEDANGNGVLDALWLAGSFDGRAAASIADRLTATALVVDDGWRRIAMVSIDNFGMILDDVEDVRSRIPAEWGVDRTLIIASGTHSAPDLVGWWTPTDAALDARWAYLEQAKLGIIDAIGRAVHTLEPARMQLAEVDDLDWSPVVDLRPPFVYDPGIRLMRFVGENGGGIGTVVSWTCTPELMGARNTALGTDFVGALRAGLEKGVGDRPGLGGMSLFLNGAFGGRLTVPDGAGPADPNVNTAAGRSRSDEASDLGNSLAEKALDASYPEPSASTGEVRLFTVTLSIPVENPRVRAAARSDRVHRAMTTDSLFTTEMNMFLLGEAWVLMLPGEVFPEQVNGGIVSVEGGDFEGLPETPNFRPVMHGQVNIVAGNANDALGPVIPYIEWDMADPRIEGSEWSEREESRATGPLTANLTQRGFIGLMRSVMGYLSSRRAVEEGNDVQ